MSLEVDSYIDALPAEQRKALTTLRARLKAFLPDHLEVMTYAMPGFRQPGPKGKMVIGYAAFAKHLGLYPHSGTVIPQIDCTPFKTSKSGVLFTPGGTVVVVVLTDGNADRRWARDNAGNVLCAKVARAVYDHFNPTTK